MLAEPKCFTRRCKHFLGIDQPDGTEMTEKLICEAFSHGIPGEISYGDNLHLKPLPNQGNDIVFEEGEMLDEG